MTNEQLELKLNFQPCPSCQTQTPLQSSWILRRGKGIQKTTWRIFLYKCPKCGRSFRKPLRI